MQWFNTSDGDCTNPALSVNRIAYSVDRRSPWNDVYEALPVKYGAYYLFFVPVFRHWQYGAIDPSDPNKRGRASTGPPFWTAGDGIVEPRLMTSEDGLNLSYTSASNGASVIYTSTHAKLSQYQYHANMLPT